MAIDVEIARRVFTYVVRAGEPPTAIADRLVALTARLVDEDHLAAPAFVALDLDDQPALPLRLARRLLRSPTARSSSRPRRSSWGFEGNAAATELVRAVTAIVVHADIVVDALRIARAGGDAQGRDDALAEAVARYRAYPWRRRGHTVEAVDDP